MKRRLFYLKSDSDSLDSVFVLSTDDGRFWEGWTLSVGFDNKPSLRYSTYKANDPELVEVSGITKGTHTMPLAASQQTLLEMSQVDVNEKLREVTRG